MANRSSDSGLVNRREFAGISTLMLGLAPFMAYAESHDVLKDAARVLGSDAIKTLQFTASGSNFTVGQNFTPDDPWPRVSVRTYIAAINYDTGSMKIDLVREMGATMPRGGGVPFTGELHQIQAVSGNFAWNVPVSASPPGGGAGPATPNTIPEAGGTSWAGPGGSLQPSPAPESQVEFMLTLWATPHGFVKAAIANNATTRKMQGGTEVSFVIGGKYRMIGFINARNQVERIRTWIGQSIVGDMLIETEYSDYNSFNGFLFPLRILQKQDGFPSLDLTVASVTPNPVVTIIVPENVRNAPVVPPVTVKAQEIAGGVFWLTGGTHHSLAIEMRDHIVLVDTPNGESRALAVIAKAKEIIPGKPIRFVIAMHHHWDHLGGIRTAIDEGATIVTHRTNRVLLERAATAKHTVNADRLSLSNRPLKIRLIDASDTLTDGDRTIMLYTMTNFDHTDDMIMVYLPKEKVLTEADAYTPPQTPTTPLVESKVPYAASLYDNIQRLKLDVRVIVPFHGMRTADFPEIAKQSGKVAAATH